MLNTVNIFGEFIEVEVKQMKSDSYKAVVMKYVDGKFRTSIPADSFGKARKVAQSIIKYNMA